MHRICSVLLALATTSPAFAKEDLTLWGCAQGGERRNALYLADRGSGSYVKVGAQRIDARVSADENGKRWTFGSNHITLTTDGLADYYEGDVAKGRFRCRPME